MTKYRLPAELGGAEIDAQEQWGGCAGGRPQYELDSGITVLMPPGTPMEAVPPLIPKEPGPGAYLIGDLVAENDGDRSAGNWCYVGTHEWRYWDEFWAKAGGPDVAIVPLVPQTEVVPAPKLPDVQLPWSAISMSGLGLEVSAIDTYDFSGVRLIVASLQVHLRPSTARSMAAALLVAADAAEELS